MSQDSVLLRTMQLKGMTVRVYRTKVDLSQAAAILVGERLRLSLVDQGQAAILFSTGASQYDFMTALRGLTGVDWGRVTAFHLDEYVGIASDHPASFRRYLQERLFDHLPFGAVHLLQGDAPDPQAECDRYAALLGHQPIDVGCIGIGENAHLAFNDPPADFTTPARVHIVTLDEACRRQQVGEGHFSSLAAVPPQALSMTVPAILQSRVIVSVVPDRRKAAAVRCALEGPLTPDCPASALRTHGECHLFLDEGSAGQLSAALRGEP